MRLQWKRLSLTAVLMLAAFTGFTGAASAASVSLNPGGNMTLTSQGLITFEGEGERGRAPIICEYVFTGSWLAGPIPKVAGQNWMRVSGMTARNCTGGTFAGALNLPWNVNFNTITGVLPEEVTAFLVRIVRAQILFDRGVLPVIECLYAGDIGASFALTRIGPSLYSVGEGRLLNEGVPFLRGEEFECPAAIRPRGNLTMMPRMNLRRL